VIGVALGGLFIGAILWTRIQRPRVRLIAATAAGVAILSLVTVLAVTPLGARALAAVNRPAAAGDAAVTGGLDPSLATRLALYDIARQMVAERPVLGYGPDSFALGVPKY